MDLFILSSILFFSRFRSLMPLLQRSGTPQGAACWTWTLAPPPTERFTPLSGPRRTWWRGPWTPPDRPSPLLTWANTLVSGVPQQGRDVIGSWKRWMCLLLIQASTLGLERWTSVPLSPSRMSPWMIVSTVPIFLERDSRRCFTFQVRQGNVADLFKEKNTTTRLTAWTSSVQHNNNSVSIWRGSTKRRKEEFTVGPSRRIRSIAREGERPASQNATG